MKTGKNGLDEKKMKIVKIYENGWEGIKVEWGDKIFLTNVERMLWKLEWMKKGSSCELQGQVAKGGEQKGVHNTFLRALFFVCFVCFVSVVV
jgi:hypothetical protein